MEAKVVMAKLLQRFDFSLLPGQSFDILDTGTLRPKSGVVCKIRHRGQTPAAWPDWDLNMTSTSL
jgi:cholesterol 24(S)-hydroxylase